VTKLSHEARISVDGGITVAELEAELAALRRIGGADDTILRPSQAGSGRVVALTATLRVPGTDTQEEPDGDG
jgi:hypothetical protein